MPSYFYEIWKVTSGYYTFEVGLKITLYICFCFSVFNYKSYIKEHFKLHLWKLSK